MSTGNTGMSKKMTPTQIREEIWNLDTRLLGKIPNDEYYSRRDALTGKLDDMGLEYKGTTEDDGPDTITVTEEELFRVINMHIDNEDRTQSIIDELKMTSSSCTCS